MVELSSREHTLRLGAGFSGGVKGPTAQTLSPSSANGYVTAVASEGFAQSRHQSQEQFPRLSITAVAVVGSQTPFLTPHNPVQNEYLRHESTSPLDFETRKLPGRRGTRIKILSTSNISDDQWLEKVFLCQVKLWV